MDDYSQYAHYGSLLMTIGGVVWGVSKIAARNEASAKAAKAIALEAKTDAAAAAKEAGEIKDKLADFREHVATKYASIETLERYQREIIGAVNRLSERIDKIIDSKIAEK
jgi:hypothetical protein